METRKEDDDRRSAFGMRLLAARRAADLSQKQAAARVGITQSTLAGLEKEGAGSTLSVAFALLYGVNPVWLAMGVGPVRGGLPAPDWLLELRDDERERVQQFAENLMFARATATKRSR
ncbi:transcriptional regulator with XRE-family HTH domain [Paraburkholderia sp. GAS448]|uniref:helix-turn-helix domain-containing protein n=1 Tax=Paraburkholderia sp. GAS448 TaxID=3035136 RepID=UPI003D192733